MRQLLLLPTLVLAFHCSFAQRFSVKGQLTDSLSNPMPGATIMLLQQKDSSLVQFGMTDAKGSFELKNIASGNYIFKTSFLGYKTLVRKIASPTVGSEVNLGLLKMRSKTNQLDEIVVEGEKDPVTVKRDTIEFNAASFKTKANANVEDLLKKLPGVEVDNDGTIRARGEQVQRVMVDGKEFFGQDPKMATRNLPADAVNKVQVYDKKSDQAVFSGIDDGQKEKTINLELKEEKRHAAFGNDVVGAGSNNRFQAKASLNRFERGNQLSFLGMGNNINQQGFSFGDYANFSGASTGAAGGGAVTVQVNQGSSQSGPQINTGQQSGIVTNYAGGANANQTYNNNKTKVNASYFYNRLDQNLISNIHRINYLGPDSTYNFDQNSTQHSTNDNHRVNLTVDQKIDSANSLKFTSSGTYNISGQTLQSIGKTMNVGNVGLKNENDRVTTSNGNSMTFNSSMLLRHRFRKKGRTISSTVTFAYNQNDAKGTLNSSTIQNPDTENKTTNSLQRNTQNTSSPTHGVNASYTEPLGGRKYLELNYNFTTDINKVDREVFNTRNGLETRNDSLTNKYNSNYLYNRPGFNFRVNRDKFNFSTGAAYQQTKLNGNLILKNEKIDRLFHAVLPAAHFNYDFTNFKRLRLDYTTNMQEPTIQQLQPIVDNSDPLNLSVGNPQLKPAYAHQVRSNFTFFDPSRFMNVFALLNANYTKNSITNAQSVDKNLVRTTMPVNVRYNMSLSGNFNVGIPVKAINSRFNIGPNYNTSRGINLINNQENTTKQQTVGSTARYNYSLGEILILDLSANMSRQETKYSFSSQQNQVYLNQTYTAELNVNFLKNYSYNSEMDYYIYNSKTTNYHQSIPLWNMSVSRYLLKNKAGELKVGVNNLLNRSLSVTQSSGTNYLQQQTNNNLGRYYMISFTYALNKQLNPMGGGGGRRGPGGPRMMIRN